MSYDDYATTIPWTKSARGVYEGIPRSSGRRYHELRYRVRQHGDKVLLTGPCALRGEFDTFRDAKALALAHVRMLLG